jgi:hypothetical protein
MLTRILVFSTVLTLFTVGSALAGGGFVADTSLTLSASPGTHVNPGTLVDFSGRLRSSRAFCESDSRVSLRAYSETQGDPFDGGVVRRTNTDANGNYEFNNIQVNDQTRFRVWFRGKVGGVHPNLRTCHKTRSRTVTIFVD